MMKRNPVGPVIVDLPESNLAPHEFEYAWKPPMCQMDTIESAYNEFFDKQVIKLTGSGFPDGDLTAISMLIDGVSTVTYATSETQALFFIIEDISEPVGKLRVFCEDGHAGNFNGFDGLLIGSDLEETPAAKKDHKPCFYKQWMDKGIQLGGQVTLLKEENPLEDQDITSIPCLDNFFPGANIQHTNPSAILSQCLR